MTTPAAVKRLDDWGEFRRNLAQRELLYIARKNKYELYAMGDTDIMTLDLPFGHESARLDRAMSDLKSFRQSYVARAKKIQVPPMGVVPGSSTKKLRKGPRSEVKYSVPRPGAVGVKVSDGNSKSDIPDVRGSNMSDQAQPQVEAQAAPKSAQKAGQNDAAVKDAERFINTLFRGLMGDLDEKLEELEQRVMAVIVSKFDALQFLIGFEDVSIELAESSVVEAPEPKPKATSPIVVTLKSKVETLVKDQLDDARQTLIEKIEETKLVASATQGNVKALEDRLRKGTIQTTTTATFKFPEAEKEKAAPSSGGK